MDRRAICQSDGVSLLKNSNTVYFQLNIKNYVIFFIVVTIIVVVFESTVSADGGEMPFG